MDSWTDEGTDKVTASLLELLIKPKNIEKRIVIDQMSFLFLQPIRTDTVDLNL